MAEGEEEGRLVLDDELLARIGSPLRLRRPPTAPGALSGSGMAAARAGRLARQHQQQQRQQQQQQLQHKTQKHHGQQQGSQHQQEQQQQQQEEQQPQQEQQQFNLWGRARRVFMNAILTEQPNTQAGIEAIREGERMLLGNSDTIRVVPRRDNQSANSSSSTSDELHPPSSPLSLSPTSRQLSASASGEGGAAGGAMVEAKQFVVVMRQEWLNYLQDELLMIKIERQNAMVEEQQRRKKAAAAAAATKAAGQQAQQHASSNQARAAAAGFALEKPHLALSDDEYGSTGALVSKLDVEMPEFKTPRFHMPRSTSDTERTNLFGDDSSDDGNGDGGGKEDGGYSEGVREAGSRKAGGGALADRLDVPRPPRQNDVSRESGVGGAGANHGGGSGGANRVGGGGGGGGARPQRHRRTATIGTVHDLDSMLSSLEGAAGADDPTARGVRAAKAAAEAATAGGRRMLRVWQRMKEIIPKTANADAEHATMHHLPMAGSALSQALKNGEIFAEERGAAWTAIACADPDDPVVNQASLRKCLMEADELQESVAHDLQRIHATLYHPTSSSSSSPALPHHATPSMRDDGGANVRQPLLHLPHGTPSLDSLCNIVRAYLAFDPELGYCQGMGFIAATVLRAVAGEEEAFAVVLFLLHRCGMRSVLQHDMDKLQQNMYKLTTLLLDLLPRIHDHFEDLELKTVMYAGDWFLTLFSRRMPPYLVLRVFDVILAEKTLAIVFKLTIVLLQMCQLQLLQCPQVDFCLYFLRTEFPLHLRMLSDGDLEELVAKALRADLPFESLLRLEAEYDLLAGEAAAAARQVQAAALASEAAAATWESDRKSLEEKLLAALDNLSAVETNTIALFAEFEVLSSLFPPTSSAERADASGNSAEEVPPSPLPLPPSKRVVDEQELRQQVARKIEDLAAEQAAKATTPRGSTPNVPQLPVVDKAASNCGPVSDGTPNSSAMKLRSASGRPMGHSGGALFARSLSTSDPAARTPAALAKDVAALRRERAAVRDALAAAEAELAKRIREDNARIAEVKKTKERKEEIRRLVTPRSTTASAHESIFR